MNGSFCFIRRSSRRFGIRHKFYEIYLQTAGMLLERPNTVFSKQLVFLCVTVTCYLLF